MQADRNNAHIRRGNRSKRADPEVQASEAKQLLESPAFERGFEGLREDIIKTIESGQHDGSPEFEAAEREMCRTLRNLHALKNRIRLAINRQQLRVAEFKSKQPEKSEGAA